MIGLLIASAIAVGVGTKSSAKNDNTEAKNINEEAYNVYQKARNSANAAESRYRNAATRWENAKRNIYEQDIQRFAKLMKKVGRTEIEQYKEMFDIEILREIGIFDTSQLNTEISTNNTTSKVHSISGAATALGTVDVLAGGALLGGSGIAIGGLAGGTLLGAVAAPVFALSGVFSKMESVKNLEQARKNLSKANSYIEECDSYVLFANSVSDRYELFTATLVIFDIKWLRDDLDKMERIVNAKSNLRNSIRLKIFNKRSYTREEIALFAKIGSIIKVASSMIQLNILDSNCNLNNKSYKVLLEQQKVYGGEDFWKSKGIDSKEFKSGESALQLRANLIHKKEIERVRKKRQIIGVIISFIIIGVLAYGVQNCFAGNDEQNIANENVEVLENNIPKEIVIDENTQRENTNDARKKKLLNAWEDGVIEDYQENFNKNSLSKRKANKVLKKFWYGKNYIYIESGNSVKVQKGYFSVSNKDNVTKNCGYKIYSVTKRKANKVHVYYSYTSLKDVVFHAIVTKRKDNSFNLDIKSK